MPRRKLIAVSIVLPVMALGATAPAQARTRTLKVGDNWFVRSSGVPKVTVKRGDKVRWRWTGRRSHNVTVRRGPRKFRSRTQRRGRFTKRLTRRGTYRIYCTIHGARDQSMILRVR